MSKYGRIEMGAPDITQDVAALKDLYQKGEIEKSEYHSKLTELQRQKMSYIVRTNGGYTPSKKMIKQYNQLIDSLNEAKKKHEVWTQQKNREEFLAALAQQQEEARAAMETPPESAPENVEG